MEKHQHSVPGATEEMVGGSGGSDGVRAELKIGPETGGILVPTAGWVNMDLCFMAWWRPGDGLEENGWVRMQVLQLLRSQPPLGKSQLLP